MSPRDGSPVQLARLCAQGLRVRAVRLMFAHTITSCDPPRLGHRRDPTDAHRLARHPQDPACPCRPESRPRHGPSATWQSRCWCDGPGLQGALTIATSVPAGHRGRCSPQSLRTSTHRSPADGRARLRSDCISAAKTIDFRRSVFRTWSGQVAERESDLSEAPGMQDGMSSRCSHGVIATELANRRARLNNAQVAQ